MTSYDVIGIDAAYFEFRNKVTATCKRKFSDLESETKKLSDQLTQVQSQLSTSTRVVSEFTSKLNELISKNNDLTFKNKELASKNKELTTDITKLRKQRTKWIASFMAAADEDNNDETYLKCSVCKKGSMTLAYNHAVLKEFICTGSCGDIVQCTGCHEKCIGQICVRCKIPGSRIVDRMEKKTDVLALLGG